MENNNREIVYDIYEKASGLSDMDWSEICEKHNLQCHPDTLRKAGVGIRLAAEAGVLDFSTPEMKEYDEIYKEKQKFYDQRRLYNKELREDARADYLAEELIKAAHNLSDLKPLPHHACMDWFEPENKNEAILLLSDWHYGMVASNVYNEFNTQIADRRIAKLRDEVIQKLQAERVNKLSIWVGGDMISGSIHTSNRIMSTEVTVVQLMMVCERIAELVANLSLFVDEVCIYTCYGNHARSVSSYEDMIHSDNWERMIPFWLKERFSDHETIHVCDGTAHEMVGFQVKGFNICGVHGDLDTKADAALTLAMLYKRNYGEDMDVLLSGHLHEHKNIPVLNIECVQSGCLCGVDEYAKNKRLFNRPSQTLLIFDDDGIDSVHNIMLDKC